MAGSTGSSPRILFLAFEPSLRRMVSEVLSTEGYEVIITGTANEAHDIIEHDPSRFVVLTDNYHATAPPLILAKTIFARPDIHARVRVIGLNTEVWADRIPLDVFITMPFCVETLLDTIERACAELRGGE